VVEGCPFLAYWLAQCPVVVHYWAHLQSVHGFRCYDNIHCSTEREMFASVCTRSMPGVISVQINEYKYDDCDVLLDVCEYAYFCLLITQRHQK